VTDRNLRIVTYLARWHSETDWSIAILAPLAVLRGSLGLAYVQLSCVTDAGLVCVVEHYDLTELKGILYYILTG